MPSPPRLHSPTVRPSKGVADDPAARGHRPPRACRTAHPDRSPWFFTTILGLTENGRSGDSVHLRTWDDCEHHSLTLTAHPASGIRRTAPRAAGAEALHRRVKEAEAAGLPGAGSRTSPVSARSMSPATRTAMNSPSTGRARRASDGSRRGRTPCSRRVAPQRPREPPPWPSWTRTCVSWASRRAEAQRCSRGACSWTVSRWVSRHRRLPWWRGAGRSVPLAPAVCVARAISPPRSGWPQPMTAPPARTAGPADRWDMTGGGPGRREGR